MTNVVKKTPGVEDAEGVLTRTSVVVNNKEQEISYISGISERYLKIFGEADFVDPLEGRQLKDSDRSKIIVGYNHVFGDIWEKPLRLGDDLEIKGKEFEIVGVLQKQGNSGDDNSVWMEKETFRDLFEIGDEEGTLVAQVDAGFDVEEIAEKIRDALRDEKNQKKGQETFISQQEIQGLICIYLFNRSGGKIHNIFIHNHL